ncbi:hypothetical protein [Ornithinibacillus bavariensis]|uniref:Uncharacterized protein n=1 Tax=Ornithinibacillus bavariensis TaxID=545502 RepID=A0A920C7C6_9BACI|nr:hypothetical protein [Ornithinibacillus bavariensis]GIO28705.1 hypothetical protein J43TS3_33160 [Ornithinibacillus bavariensis]
MKQVNEHLKNQLDKELEIIQFSGQKEVLNRVYPKTWKQKFLKLWNKELTIPIVPVSAVFVLLIMVIGYVEIKPTEHSNRDNEKRELINVAGNYYWKDAFEKELKKHED